MAYVTVYNPDEGTYAHVHASRGMFRCMWDAYEREHPRQRPWAERAYFIIRDDCRHVVWALWMTDGSETIVPVSMDDELLYAVEWGDKAGVRRLMLQRFRATPAALRTIRRSAVTTSRDYGDESTVVVRKRRRLSPPPSDGSAYSSESEDDSTSLCTV